MTPSEARPSNTQDLVAALDRVQILLRAGVPRQRALVQGRLDPTSLTDPSVRAVLAVALATGVPTGHAIARLQTLVRDGAAASEEIKSALAAPLLARRIVMLVPIASIALGAALGFNVLPALVSSVLGVLCLVGGALLSLVGWAWMRKLVRRATDHPPAPGLWCELVAGVVASGLPLGRAVIIAEAALATCGVAAPEVARAQGRNLLVIATQAGVPISVALQHPADDQRAKSFAEQRRAARELGERILVPVGACYLPAFLLWGVVPLVGSVVSDTLLVS